MQIGPLITHAMARIPALTDLFSDPFPVVSMAVTAAANTVLTTAAPHGLSPSKRHGLCVVDAATPNAVVAIEAASDGDYRLTFEHDHALTAGPRPGSHAWTGPSYMPTGAEKWWDLAVTLAGFTDAAAFNGLCQLIDVPDRRTVVITPRAVPATLALNGHEVLLERLEQGLAGWHAASVTGPSALSFATPAGVTRSFTVTAPKVSRRIRIAGSLNRDVVGQQYVRGYQSYLPPVESVESLAAPWLFIVPAAQARLSKDRNAQTDATAEITPASDYRQLLIDGFEVLALLPARDAIAGVECSDKAQGPVLRAVLRTFHGLKVHRPELATQTKQVALLSDHGAAAYDRATYMHAYTFEANAFLTNKDAVQPFEWTAVYGTPGLPAFEPGSTGGIVTPFAAPGDGTYTPPAEIAPIGTVPLQGLVFGPDPEGIRHDDAPTPLICTVAID